jgi:thymidine phosphorylase
LTDANRLSGDNNGIMIGRHTARMRRLGIDTHHEAVVYMRADCHICRAEGFRAHARVGLSYRGRTIIATLHQVMGDWLRIDEAGLSETAWRALNGREEDEISIEHPPTLESLSYLRAKIYGNALDDVALHAIVRDISAGFYDDVELACFITACAGTNLRREEIIGLTRAMVDVGDRIDWGRTPIVDKHSIGGLPGNRTSPIIVAIVAASGLTMPKTSSRAITSPAGTADTMETLAPVDLDLRAMRKVVEREGGCVVWGGPVHLSPADDILIQVERALDLDSVGQLIASVLSKKVAAGSTHLVIDVPVGATAKARTQQAGEMLRDGLVGIASVLGIKARALLNDGSQPVGRGIGPALEARDVLAVLRNELDAPEDLRARAAALAGALLELASAAVPGTGESIARAVIEDGRAWHKFEAICEAQGGMRTPPQARHTRAIPAKHAGRITAIDNRLLGRAAKLAGAPDAKAAGLLLHVRVGDSVARGQPLFTLHAENPGELSYALDYVEAKRTIVQVFER